MIAMYEQIKIETENAVRELVEKSKLKKGSLVVVGCSSSEILGEHIGKGSSPETGVVVAEAILKVLNENGIYLAAQCCEHLNRALVVERAAAEKYMLDEVCVRPMPKAGGSFATAVYDRMSDPAVVIDTNHSNSGKQWDEQPRIAKEILHSTRHSDDILHLVKGLMIESYIEDGNQKPDGGVYGKSITDACIGWDKTERLIYELADLR